MARLKQQTQNKFVILLWGPALSGKTILASQFPKPYFIDLDGQMGSVLALAKKSKADIDFPVIRIDESPTEDEDFLELCGKNFAKLSAWVKLKKLIEVLSRQLGNDETLVLDNLSRAGEFLTADIKRKSGRQQLQIQDWGTFYDEMSTLVEYLHTPYGKSNTILIGHEGSSKDELTGELFKVLLMPGSFKNRIPSLVSDYLYLNVNVTGPRNKREIRRILQSVPDPKNPVGTRSMIPDLVDPTYQKMRPFIEDYLGRKLGEPTWTPIESPQ
jgi:hypothetical protein